MGRPTAIGQEVMATIRLYLCTGGKSNYVCCAFFLSFSVPSFVCTWYSALFVSALVALFCSRSLASSFPCFCLVPLLLPHF